MDNPTRTVSVTETPRGRRDDTGSGHVSAPNDALAVDVIADWLSGHSVLNLPQRAAAARELLDALADASLAVCAESQEPP